MNDPVARDFGYYIFSDVVYFIQRNLKIGDVYDADTIIQYVKENFKPEDIYSEEELERK